MAYRDGGGGAAPAGERCFQTLCVCDLFKKLAQKMEEAGVLPMKLPPIRSVSFNITVFINCAVAELMGIL